MRRLGRVTHKLSLPAVDENSAVNRAAVRAAVHPGCVGRRVCQAVLHAASRGDWGLGAPPGNQTCFQECRRRCPSLRSPPRSLHSLRRLQRKMAAQEALERHLAGLLARRDALWARHAEIMNQLRHRNLTPAEQEALWVQSDEVEQQLNEVEQQVDAAAVAAVAAAGVELQCGQP